jgi:DNA-binding CsgD family transcriptional regulator
MIAWKNTFSTSDIAFAVDSKGRIVVWNQAAEQSFGYAESEAKGQRCWDLLEGYDAFGNPSCCQGCPILKKALRHEPVYRFQLDLKTATQGRKLFSINNLLVSNDLGEEVLVHLCSFDRDEPTNPFINNATNLSTTNNQIKSLTPRETEILTLLHDGKTISEIATSKCISVFTVRNHTQRILNKLHAHTQLEAVALGRRFGMI